jgi:hypothetical protein
MKIHRLETHDRFQHLVKDQSQTIWQGADDCINKNDLSLKLQEYSPYIYIFAHPRTHDDGVSKRMLWQPRLTKPNSQTNSYLFRLKSHSDIVEICWLLPPREMWGQYSTGKVCESNWTSWSIDMFKHRREELDKPFPDDLTDEQAKRIYLIIAHEKEKTHQTTTSSLAT